MTPRNQMQDGELRAHIRSVVEACGIAAAVKELGLSKATIASYLAGLDVTPGTRAILELATLRRTGGTRDAM